MEEGGVGTSGGYGCVGVAGGVPGVPPASGNLSGNLQDANVAAVLTVVSPEEKASHPLCPPLAQTENADNPSPGFLFYFLHFGGFSKYTLFPGEGNVYVPICIRTLTLFIHSTCINSTCTRVLGLPLQGTQLGGIK